MAFRIWWMQTSCQIVDIPQVIPTWRLRAYLQVCIGSVVQGTNGTSCNKWLSVGSCQVKLIIVFDTCFVGVDLFWEANGIRLYEFWSFHVTGIEYRRVVFRVEHIIMHVKMLINFIFHFMLTLRKHGSIRMYHVIFQFLRQFAIIFFNKHLLIPTTLLLKRCFSFIFSFGSISINLNVHCV